MTEEEREQILAEAAEVVRDWRPMDDDERVLIESLFDVKQKRRRRAA